MIIYRPHRGGLAEAMAEAMEFETIQEMKEHIVKEHTDEEMGPAFCIDDIVLGEETVNDHRNGWKDTRYVCVKRYYSDNFIENCGFAQCIGMCATDYGSLDQSKRMCKEFLEA